MAQKSGLGLRRVSYFFLVLLLMFITYQLWFLLHICWWIKFNPRSSAFMEASYARLSEAKPDIKLKHQWVDYGQISRNLKQAVVAAEDAKFTTHNGFDVEGIKAAVDKNLKKGELVAGGSTITQQLAKNMFLSSSRSFFRKGQEALIAIMMEQILSKQRILEIYLNMIEWGDGVFGAEEAAKHYFKISAKRLSRDQAAKLAAMIPNPRFYDGHRQTRYLSKRASSIGRWMSGAAIP